MTVPGNSPANAEARGDMLRASGEGRRVVRPYFLVFTALAFDQEE